MTQFTTCTGRLVFGSPFKAEPVTDDDGKQKVDAAGQPIFEYVVGVAFPKGDPAVDKMLADLRAIDRAAWPQFHDANGNRLPGVVFADKITDGDGYNKKGVHYGSRDGWAGHWVIRFGSRFAPTNYSWNGTTWVQLADPAAIKPGYYVQVSGTTTSNGSAQSPGMYRNLNQVALIGYGPEIIRTGADPVAAFGAAPPPLPPGATATPVAPSAPVPAPVAAVAPPVAAVPSPAVTAPPPAPPAPVTPAAPVRVMIGQAAGTDYAAWIAQGWTDAQLIAAGHMAG